jgi:hypothetical protein
MSLSQHQIDHRECLRIASELLGAPVVALELSFELEQVLHRHARLEQRCGAAGERPIMRFLDGQQGHELAVGAERYRLQIEGRTLRIAHVAAPHRHHFCSTLYEFWATSASDYLPLYRFLRRTLRRQQRHAAPVMAAEDQRRLWDNTVGFLRHGCQRLKEFGVPQKRGVLLLGEPGNGKTMACRWLRSECNRYGLSWRNVSAEDFESARREGDAHELFDLERAGIVFFDDVDMALRQRGTFDPVAEQSTFLAGLDGLDVNRGVIYLFTTNARLEDLDGAFRRPGRIDLVLHFSRPDAVLRRRLIEACWTPQIVAGLNVERVVAQTAGLSFAEMEEIKKLLVLRYLECGEFNWDWALGAFRIGRGGSDARPRIGFLQRAGAFESTHALCGSGRDVLSDLESQISNLKS